MDLLKKEVRIKLLDYEIEPEFFINALDDVKKAMEAEKFEHNNFCHKSTDSFIFYQTSDHSLLLSGMIVHEGYYILCVVERIDNISRYIRSMTSLAKGSKNDIFNKIEELKEYFSN